MRPRACPKKARRSRLGSRQHTKPLAAPAGEPKRPGPRRAPASTLAVTPSSSHSPQVEIYARRCQNYPQAFHNQLIIAQFILERKVLEVLERVGAARRRSAAPG